VLARGVHVLPCSPFHWADPAGGLRYIRVSLARPSDTVEVAARTLARSYRELAAAGG
jgi:aspartate/methionine/tyrosine aminotransferase